MRVVCVAGARPNFMKIKPVVDALAARGVEVDLVHTGQHYDPAMSDVFFDELGIRKPDHFLGVGSGSQAETTARVMIEFETLLASVPSDVVVVVGDVNSTLGCALVAAKAGTRVAHVEAGLRSRDWAMPEEVNRVVADRVSDFLFAPSQDAVDNLVSEGYRADQIHLVGNVMIDTLLANTERAQQRSWLQDHHLTPGDYALVTLHRPSNVDDPVMLERHLGTLEWMAGQLPVVFPCHPRTAARLGDRFPNGVQVVAPLGYLDFIALEAAARLVVTDSGGVQEETTVLGVPCLTVRESTERPITVSEGTNRVVGTDTAVVQAAITEVLANGVTPRRPALWDGQAAQRIADVLVDPNRFGGRPTDR